MDLLFTGRNPVHLDQGDPRILRVAAGPVVAGRSKTRRVYGRLPNAIGVRGYNRSAAFHLGMEGRIGYGRRPPGPRREAPRIL
jgi:hypothetical protein